MKKHEKEVSDFLAAVDRVRENERLAKTIPFLCLCGFEEARAKEIARFYSDSVNKSRLFPKGYRRHYVEVDIPRENSREDCLRMF